MTKTSDLLMLTYSAVQIRESETESLKWRCEMPSAGTVIKKEPKSEVFVREKKTQL
jgi:hypothetical protein